MGQRMNWGRVAEQSRMSQYGSESTGAAGKDPNARWTHLKAAPCYRVHADGTKTLIVPKKKTTPWNKLPKWKREWMARQPWFNKPSG